MEMVNFMPSFKCKDIGINCPFEATAKTSAELMKMITVHENKEHHMKSVPHDRMEKIKKAIKP
jgi:predicted small metal-binding protein